MSSLQVYPTGVCGLGLLTCGTRFHEPHYRHGYAFHWTTLHNKLHSFCSCGTTCKCFLSLGALVLLSGAFLFSPQTAIPSFVETLGGALFGLSFIEMGYHLLFKPR